jgi:hypothetical protein
MIAVDATEDSKSPNEKEGEPVSSEVTVQQPLMHIVRQLDALGIGKQSLDDFPVKGYSPEQVMNAQSRAHRRARNCIMKTPRPSTPVFRVPYLT